MRSTSSSSSSGPHDLAHKGVLHVASLAASRDCDSLLYNPLIVPVPEVAHKVLGLELSAGVSSTGLIEIYSLCTSVFASLSNCCDRCRERSSSQPLKNLVPPSLPPLRDGGSPEGHTLGSAGPAPSSVGSLGSGQLNSLPIVLSRQNSSSTEEDAASEPEAAGQLSSTSEEAASADESAQTHMEAPELPSSRTGAISQRHHVSLSCCKATALYIAVQKRALPWYCSQSLLPCILSVLPLLGDQGGPCDCSCAGYQGNGKQQAAYVQINGDARPGIVEQERPLSARSFSRSGSTSFSKGLLTGEGAIPGADHWHQESRQPWDPCMRRLLYVLRHTAMKLVFAR